MIALLILAMASDAATFAIGVSHVGIAAELNPIAAFGYGEVGLLAAVALKLAAATVIILVLRRIHRVGLRRVAAALAIGITLAGTAANVANGMLA